jgi:hypothetical protein
LMDFLMDMSLPAFAEPTRNDEVVKPPIGHRAPSQPSSSSARHTSLANIR